MNENEMMVTLGGFILVVDNCYMYCLDCLISVRVKSKSFDYCYLALPISSKICHSNI